MEIIHGNDSNYESLIKEGYVLVDFFANWCGPCKMLAPVLESIKDKIQIVKIDVDESESIARQNGIMSIPTLFLYKDGKLVSSMNGYVPEPVLTKWIDDNR